MAASTTRAPKRCKLLSGEERKRTILEAARAEFANAGDIGGTTTKMIAKRAGVSEAIIARARNFFAETIASMTESLPLLGLVLFGEPKTAKRFYDRCWRPAMERLSSAWRSYYVAAGVEDFPDPDVAARITLGACMTYALDSRYGDPGDPRRTAHLLAEAGFDGMWLRGT